MAHLVKQMAYVGATPWHGLGNRLTQKQPLELWQREAGMNWQIQESPVHFKADTVGNLGTIHSFPEQKVLYRSDNKAPLSVVPNRYQVVQPREVLEFYRDLTEVSGYELETAGILKGGRKFWALARTGQTTALKGNDQVNGYLLLATSCDGTLATTATPTTVRVVCNNTLTIALDGNSRASRCRTTRALIRKPLRNNWASRSPSGTSLCTACAHWRSARCSGMRRWASS
jgi:phage/plasmid-like protein (TIGR03299 family)